MRRHNLIKAAGVPQGGDIYGPTDGLLAYWPLNGDTNDYSGNGHDATLVGSGISFVSGYGGVQAAQTDGTVNGFIDYSDIEMNGLSSFAISLFSVDMAYGSIGRLFSKDRIGVQGALILQRQTTAIAPYAHDGSSFVSFTYNMGLGAAAWPATHFVFQLSSDRSRIELYINGTYTTGVAFSGTLDDSDSEIITLFADSNPIGTKGQQAGSGSKLQGVRLYNRELTVAEIATLYNEFTA